VAPTGTVTVKLVAVAWVTVALVAPKNTILLALVVLKFIPLIITDVPTGPLEGLKPVIVGGTDNGLTVMIFLCGAFNINLPVLLLSDIVFLACASDPGNGPCANANDVDKAKKRNAIFFSVKVFVIKYANCDR
jgi:hypothetical protein